MEKDNKFCCSLLVPCHNSADYIDDFLKNLLNLTMSFDEIIFYDDASTDSTVAVLQSYKQNVIIGETNRGPGYARNQLAKFATKNYIHFHDIDDEMHPDFVSIIKDHLMHNHCEVVIGQSDWINKTDRAELLKWRYDQKLLSKNPLKYLIAHPVGGINSVYLKEAFNKIQGYDNDIRCWEDADLHVRFAASGAKINVIDKVLSISLRHSNSISNDQVWCWSCRLIFLQRYLDSYIDIIGTDVIAKELKKVQIYFIKEGQFHQLATISNLDKKYSLKIDDAKSVFIGLISHILPFSWLKFLIQLALRTKVQTSILFGNFSKMMSKLSSA